LASGAVPVRSRDWPVPRAVLDGYLLEDGVQVPKIHDSPGQQHRRVCHTPALMFMTSMVLGCRPWKVPLSAFIVADMIELVQAHATYRFVILDEEDELPRALVCLPDRFRAFPPMS
jgi:hypothetical protein